MEARPNSQNDIRDVLDLECLAPGAMRRIANKNSTPFENRATAFNSSNLVYVTHRFEASEELATLLLGLGFSGACVFNLEGAFELVSSEPDNWGFICIDLDPNLSKRSLNRWVQLIRVANFRAPIILFSEYGPQPIGEQKPTQLGDCCVRYPESTEELDRALGIAVRSNRLFGTKFSHFQNTGVPRPSRFSLHS